MVFLDAAFVDQVLDLPRDGCFALTVTPQSVGTAVPGARRRRAKAVS